MKLLSYILQRQQAWNSNSCTAVTLLYAFHMLPAGTVNRNKNWNTTPTNLVLFSVSMLLAPTLWLFITVPTALGSHRPTDTAKTAALLPSGSCSQKERKNGRSSVLFPPHFRGWDQWAVENFTPRKPEAGVIGRSNDNTGWRYIILLTSILHSFSILTHCPVFHFASYSKKREASSYKSKVILYPALLCSLLLTSGHKRAFFCLQVTVCK